MLTSELIAALQALVDDHWGRDLPCYLMQHFQADDAILTHEDPVAVLEYSTVPIEQGRDLGPRTPRILIT